MSHRDTMRKTYSFPFLSSSLLTHPLPLFFPVDYRYAEVLYRESERALWMSTSIYTLYVHSYIYVYMCNRVCVCMWKKERANVRKTLCIIYEPFRRLPIAIPALYICTRYRQSRESSSLCGRGRQRRRRRKKKKKERTIATSIHDNDDDSQRGLLLPVSLLSSLRCRERKSSNRNRARTRTQPLLRACALVSRGRSFVWRTRDVYMYVCICMCVCM